LRNRYKEAQPKAMTYSELKSKLKEGMTTGVLSYGFDFQVDVVDQSVTDFQKFVDDKDYDFGRISHQNKFKPTKQKFNRKDENIPWEIENAASATERQQTISRWLKVASGKNLQIVNNKSIVAIPKWQDVHIES
jgi:hypothetical protein